MSNVYFISFMPTQDNFEVRPKIYKGVRDNICVISDFILNHGEIMHRAIDQLKAYGQDPDPCDIVIAEMGHGSQ